jgi:hypothetical protein
MDMLLTTLSLLLAVAPVTKLEKGQLEKTTLDMKLPDMPKTDGLAGPAKEAQLETKHAAGDLRSVTTGQTAGTKVSQVTHAKDFARSPNGYKPMGRIDSFAVGTLPAKTGAFRTCVRLATTDGVPVSLRAQIKSPSNTELLSSDRVDVTFGTASYMEVVIDWPGFEATQAGDYKLVVTLDGQAAGDFPIPVSGK